MDKKRIANILAIPDIIFNEQASKNNRTCDVSLYLIINFRRLSFSHVFDAEALIHHLIKTG